MEEKKKKVFSKYCNEKFLVGTFDRAVASFSQAALAFITAGATGILTLNYIELLSVSALAALASILTSFSSPERIVNAEKEAESVLTGNIEKIIEKQEKKAARTIRNPFKEEEL